MPPASSLALGLSSAGSAHWLWRLSPCAASILVVTDFQPGYPLSSLRVLAPSPLSIITEVASGVPSRAVLPSGLGAALKEYPCTLWFPGLMGPMLVSL